MPIFEICHDSIVDLCHDFGTQPLLIRSPFLREFTTSSVLLSRIKGGKCQNLLSQFPFNSLMRWNGVTVACDLDLMNQMHYCGTFYTHRREGAMNNSYSGEGVEQVERQIATPHMVSYGIRLACGCVTYSGGL